MILKINNRGTSKYACSFFFILCSLLLFPFLSSCKKKKSNSHKTPNQTTFINNVKLHSKSSLFLKQHADNPVNWNTWDTLLFSAPQHQNKLAIISIGYASCHWCHVMEETVFMDTAVANYMNNNFTSILIDKDEQPDINTLFIEFASQNNGKAGWPLNVITLPNGKPLFASTYYSKDEWLSLLKFFNKTYQTDPNKLLELAKQNESQLLNTIISLKNNKQTITDTQIKLTFSKTLRYTDPLLGGLKQKSKFPNPVLWNYFLNYYIYMQNDSAIQIVNTTLNNMAKGGIYDHVDGGFFRYATDSRWKTPHFEKMLYDNAQLIQLYSRHYSTTQKPFYKKITEQTICFLETKMQAPNGFFYAAIDAGKNNYEGIFYTWKESEIDSLLLDNRIIFKDIFGIIPYGNWKNGQNILFFEDNTTDIAKKHNMEIYRVEEIIKKSLIILQKERQKQIQPDIDTAILTSWNAMVINAYASTYLSTNNNEYLHKAILLGELFIKHLISKNGQVYRKWINDNQYLPGFLPDYAATIESLITLYTITMDEKWLEKAVQITTYVNTYFYDSKSQLFYYNSSLEPSYFAKQLPVKDNETPSPNALMCYNLYKLGVYTGNYSYLEQSQNMLSTMQSNILKKPLEYPYWNSILLFTYKPPIQIIIVGENFRTLIKEIQKHQLKNTLIYGCAKESHFPSLNGKYKENKTTIYLCNNNSCFYQTTNLNEALKAIKNRTKT